MRCRRCGCKMRIIVSIALLAVGPYTATAAPATVSADDAAFAVFAVHIERTPKQAWPGFGVYLGNGYVLTAAHVAGTLALTHPRVVVAGKSLPAQQIKEGTFEGDDLTFLRVDTAQLPLNVRSARVELCTREPPVGSDVVVVTPERSATSHLAAPSILSHEILSRFPTLISDVASTGNSGSGVFDKHSHCLLGIISRKISLHVHKETNGHEEYRTIDLAKYFVGFDVIAKAMPVTMKF